jgi:hypothetical protein
MTFLEPLLLWGLPLAALPIIIHLLNLRRHRKVEWGAMMFLLQATRQRRGHTRLRHWLILLTRVLAVAALIFVISRPMAGRWFGLLGGRPETVIVVLDRSASMAQEDLQTGRSKRSAAVDQIVTAIQRAGAPRQLVLIESSGRAPHVIDSAAALRDLPETAATDHAANLPAMLQQTLDYIVANKASRTDIWVCSDLQSTDWMTDGGQWSAVRSGFLELKQPVRFHLLTYPQRPAQNRSVRILKLRRQRGSDNDQLLLDIQVRREHAGPAETVPLDIVLDGARSVIEVPLEGEAVRLSDHVVPLDRQRTAGWGKVELPSDGHPRDNVFYFTYGDSVLHRAVVVSDEPGSAWPLRLAAAPTHGAGLSEAVVISSNDLDSLRWKQTSLVLWQVAPPTGQRKQQLTEFVAAGGTVVFFPPPEEAPEPFLGLAWGGWEKLPQSDAQAVDQWRDDSGLLAHADAGDPLPVNRIEVQDYRQIVGNGQVLARLRGMHPLLVRWPTDRGGVYFCATLPQAPYSNLASEGIVLFVMVQRAMLEGTQRLVAAQFGEIGGDTPAAPDGLGQRIEGWPEGSLSTEQPHVAGVYQADDRLIARNRPASEDSTGNVSSDRLDELLAGLNYRVVQDTLQGGRSLVAEIWRVFVGLLLMALIAEACLCLPDVRPKKLVTV